MSLKEKTFTEEIAEMKITRSDRLSTEFGRLMKKAMVGRAPIDVWNNVSKEDNYKPSTA